MERNGLCLLGTVACLALATSSLAQGLGDAAKREKERRAEAPTSAKTYTQDDLSDLPPVANSSDELTPSTPAVDLPSPTAEDASSDADADSREESVSREESEYLWRSRVNAARARVEEARATYQNAANMHLVPGYAYVDKNNRPVINSVEELQAITADAKARLDAAEKELADLLELARREGVPPGWLR